MPSFTHKTHAMHVPVYIYIWLQTDRNMIVHMADALLDKFQVVHHLCCFIRLDGVVL